MKAIGYICTFCFLIFVAWTAANSAPKLNVELGMFYGMLIPIGMLAIVLVSEEP